MSATAGSHITISHKQPGTAVILIFVGTVLRVLDVVAHLVVPVPATGFWTPGTTVADRTDLLDSKQPRSDDVEINDMSSAI